MVYEDESAVAFLDIAPFDEGHTLVVPRKHVVSLIEMSQDEVAELFGVVRNVAAYLCDKLGCDGFNLMQNNGGCAGQIVDHLHVHVIPRWEGREVSWSSRKDIRVDEVALRLGYKV